MLDTLHLRTAESTYSEVGGRLRPVAVLRAWVPAVIAVFGLLLVSDALSPVALILLQLFLAF